MSMVAQCCIYHITTYYHHLTTHYHHLTTYYHHLTTYDWSSASAGIASLINELVTFCSEYFAEYRNIQKCLI